MKPLRKILFFGVLLFAAPRALAQSEGGLQVKELRKPFSLRVLGEYTGLKTEQAFLGGAGLNFNFGYAINDRYELSASVRHSLLFPSFSPYFTSIDVRATYALTGKLISTEKQYFIHEQKFASVVDQGIEGFRVSFIVGQFFFSGLQNVIPFSSFGASAFYEFPSSTNVSWVAGLRGDLMFNSSQGFYPVQVYGGIRFGL